MKKGDPDGPLSNYPSLRSLKVSAPGLEQGGDARTAFWSLAKTEAEISDDGKEDSGEH